MRTQQPCSTQQFNVLTHGVIGALLIMRSCKLAQPLKKPVAVTEQANNAVDLPVDQLLCKVDCEMR
jgi:hypothetical protein